MRVVRVIACPASLDTRQDHRFGLARRALDLGPHPPAYRAGVAFSPAVQHRCDRGKRRTRRRSPARRGAFHATRGQYRRSCLVRACGCGDLCAYLGDTEGRRCGDGRYDDQVPAPGQDSAADRGGHHAARGSALVHCRSADYRGSDRPDGRICHHNVRGWWPLLSPAELCVRRDGVMIGNGGSSSRRPIPQSGCRPISAAMDRNRNFTIFLKAVSLPYVSAAGAASSKRCGIGLIDRKRTCLGLWHSGIPIIIRSKDRYFARWNCRRLH